MFSDGGCLKFSEFSIRSNMKKIKLKKIYIISVFQILLQIAFLVWGIHFKSNSNIVDTNFLSLLTKIQTTGSLQNFIWCLTNNITVLFVIFWLSYWTFGIIGILWCVNSSFMLGAIIEISLIERSWISIWFVLLEFLASMIIVLSSTYFRFEKFRFKKDCKKNHIDVDDEKYKLGNKKREKNILIIFAVVTAILLIAATLETIALSLIKQTCPETYPR